MGKHMKTLKLCLGALQSGFMVHLLEVHENTSISVL